MPISKKESMQACGLQALFVGSSEMGLTEEEYEALSPEEKEAKCKETEEKFRKAGADIVFRTLEELKVALI